MKQNHEYRSLRLPKPSVARILLFPIELIFVAHIGILLLVGAYALAFKWWTPRINSLMVYRAVTERTPIRPTKPVPISEISDGVRGMFVRLEDGHFYQHPGIDLGAIERAYEINTSAGKIVRGGSTITQQLARTLFLTPARNYYRKYLEAVIAVELDAVLSKQRIMELYLNSIEWGPGVFGIERAAEYQYGKTFTKLTTDQVRRLAAILPSPLRYNVRDFTRSAALYDRYLVLRGASG